ncbi:MAG: SDR family oxidoreductase, partial [Dehalococcoidia bacterium]|nr:SDR family oxidoreductase [Dehalococcoidia bacterium]
MGRLAGKVAIVTGAGSGIGRATALLWAREGAKIVVADSQADSAATTVRDVRVAGGDAVSTVVDVSRADDAKRMIQTAVDTYGRLDVLFNNAGILAPRGVMTADFREEDADRIIAVNFRGVFLGTKYAIPEMIKSGGGSIISTASDTAIHGVLGCSVYSGTKGAVIAFSKSVAMEYARMGIRVNTISPCVVRTPMHASFVDTPGWNATVERIPLGRACEPEDAAY